VLWISHRAEEGCGMYFAIATLSEKALRELTLWIFGFGIGMMVATLYWLWWTR